jgi:hypothetical protein
MKIAAKITTSALTSRFLFELSIRQKLPTFERLKGGIFYLFP